MLCDFLKRLLLSRTSVLAEELRPIKISIKNQLKRSWLVKLVISWGKREWPTNLMYFVLREYPPYVFHIQVKSELKSGYDTANDWGQIFRRDGLKEKYIDIYQATIQQNRGDFMDDVSTQARSPISIQDGISSPWHRSLNILALSLPQQWQAIPDAEG